MIFRTSLTVWLLYIHFTHGWYPAQTNLKFAFKNKLHQLIHLSLPIVVIKGDKIQAQKSY